MNYKKVFDLRTEEDFINSERYKSSLENKGLKVNVKSFGLNKIIIEGF